MSNLVPSSTYGVKQKDWRPNYIGGHKKRSRNRREKKHREKGFAESPLSFGTTYPVHIVVVNYKKISY